MAIVKRQYWCCILGPRVMMTVDMHPNENEAYRASFGREPSNSCLCVPLGTNKERAIRGAQEVLQKREELRVKCMSCSAYWWRWEDSCCPRCGRMEGELRVPDTKRTKAFHRLWSEDTWKTRRIWMTPFQDGCFLVYAEEPATPLGLVYGSSVDCKIGVGETIYDQAEARRILGFIRKDLLRTGWVAA